MATLLYPPFLQWEIASECNHKCIHCYNYWRADNLPVSECDEYKLIIDKIIERKPLYVAITGGEPLLVFNKVKEAITKFVKAGIKCSISTNGTLINEEMAKFFNQYGVDLVISLPSIDKDVCDRVTSSKDVINKLENVWPLLQKYNIHSVINVVINKVNLPTLGSTLKKIKELGFEARVGIAQRPINASDNYLPFEIDQNDFKSIVKEVIHSRKELGMDIDLSVCIPDCAFSSEELSSIEKGTCFAGTIAYSVATNGDIKACQCDTKVYGNILKDDFKKVYKAMSNWRRNKYIPKECKNCQLVDECGGGCRIEAYARTGHYKAIGLFANPETASSLVCKEEKMLEITCNSEFALNEDVKFVEDLKCTRVSYKITPVHLTKKFAKWLENNNEFTYSEILGFSKNKNELNYVLNLLIKNKILVIKN